MVIIISILFSQPALVCSMTFSYRNSVPKRAIKKTISLPEDLFRELQRQAEAENKTLSGIIQEELQAAKRARLKEEFHNLQTYWSAKAQERGILSERDLERYLRK
jgi:predicted CopG family antitoxin